MMDRREFLAKAGLVATWAGVAVTITDCGGDDYGSNPGPGNNGSVSGAISANHGHAVSITEAQIDAGQGVTLTLDGPSDDHTHTLTLSAQEVMDIGAGTRVQHTSSNTSGHTHLVTFN